MFTQSIDPQTVRVKVCNNESAARVGPSIYEDTTGIQITQGSVEEHSVPCEICVIHAQRLDIVRVLDYCTWK